jgi:Ribonuclease HIII
VIDKTPHSSIERIGIDESGKGDYFGPLVIAAVFVDATTQSELTLMNVRDSKKISDGRILEMAPDIRIFALTALSQSARNDTTNSIRRSGT